MIKYPLRFPYWFNKFIFGLVFSCSQENKKIYLTFDDGPTPEITPQVLKILKQNKIKATFFCIGKKIKRHPDIFQQIINEGHQVGNHSYEHEDGWQTGLKPYLNSISKTETLIEQFTSSIKLFRPPYGHLSFSQIKHLKQRSYKIVMWTSISGDFKENLDTKYALDYLTEKTKSGDILVFHDSRKASRQLFAILPQLITNLKKRGFIFENLQL